MRDAGIERDQQRQRRKHAGRRPHHRNDGADRAALRQKSREAEAGREDRGGSQMQRDRAVGRMRPDAGNGAARHHQHVGIGEHGPFQEHKGCQHRGGGNGAGGGRRAPCDQQAARHQHRKRGHGGIGVEAGDHDDRGAEQIGGERARRDRFDPAFLRRRAEHESADHQQGGEDEARDDVEHMRADHLVFAFQAGEGPRQREHDGGDGEPAPQPDPRQREGRRGDDGEIDVERPEVGLVGRHQNGRDKARGDAEARQRRTVQQRGRQRAERHQAQQDERGRRHQEAVERVRGVDGRERHGGAGGGQDRRNVGDRQRIDRRGVFLAAQPFAGEKQRQRERAAEHDAHAGSDQARLDRIAHHEEAAERQREPADPDHPAGADALFEARGGDRLRQRRRRGSAGVGGGRNERGIRDRRGRGNTGWFSRDFGRGGRECLVRRLTRRQRRRGRGGARRSR